MERAFASLRQQRNRCLHKASGILPTSEWKECGTIRLWVSDEVEKDEKEIEKCMQKCINGSRRSHPLGFALPSQPLMIETQLVEFPSSDERFQQATATPHPVDISFTTSSSGSSGVGREKQNRSCQRTQEQGSRVEVQDGTGEHEHGDYTNSSASPRTRNEEGLAERRLVQGASATAHITVIDERSLNPFRKSLTNPSPTRKRRHDMATPSPNNNRLKQIAKKSTMQEIDEKSVCNIRRQAFVNSSHASQLQLSFEQAYEDRHQSGSLTRSQRSLNSSSGLNSSVLSYSGANITKSKLKCTSCKKLYRNNNYDMRSHINNTHLRLPLFSCAECHKHFFNRRHKAVEHIQQFHRNKSNLLIDNTATYEPIVAARLLEFFPDATIFPSRTPTGGHVSKRRVSRRSSNSIQPRGNIFQPNSHAAVHRHNFCSTPSLGRDRSGGPETRSQNSRNLTSKQQENTGSSSQPASLSSQTKQQLHSGANASLPIMQRSKSSSPLVAAAVRPMALLEKGSGGRVFIRGRSLPPREPSQLTNFNYDSGSELNRSDVTNSSRKDRTQLPTCFSPEYQENIYKGDRQKKIECRKCKTRVLAKLDWILFNHVNINHLKVPAFDCLICGESFCEYSGTSIKRHMNSYHADRLDSYQDNRPFYRSQLQEMCLAFFGRN